MRHPLWGRNQETYGEDPYLSSVLAEQFVYGLQAGIKRRLLLCLLAFVASFLLCLFLCWFVCEPDQNSTRLSFAHQIIQDTYWQTQAANILRCMAGQRIFLKVDSASTHRYERLFVPFLSPACSRVLV